MSSPCCQCVFGFSSSYHFYEISYEHCAVGNHLNLVGSSNSSRKDGGADVIELSFDRVQW
jgi:hypothetical protein